MIYRNEWDVNGSGRQNHIVLVHVNKVRCPYLTVIKMMTMVYDIEKCRYWQLLFVVFSIKNYSRMWESTHLRIFLFDFITFFREFKDSKSHSAIVSIDDFVAMSPFAASTSTSHQSPYSHTNFISIILLKKRDSPANNGQEKTYLYMFMIWKAQAL